MVVGDLDLLVGEALAQQRVLQFEDRVLQIDPSQAGRRVERELQPRFPLRRPGARCADAVVDGVQMVLTSWSAPVTAVVRPVSSSVPCWRRSRTGVLYSCAKRDDPSLLRSAQSP
jgi:hypothetical protein